MLQSRSYDSFFYSSIKELIKTWLYIKIIIVFADSCPLKLILCAVSLFLPDLVLQEAHVTVQQGVGRRKDPHRLHPCPPLCCALHCHVGKTGEAKVAALTEVAVEGETNRWGHESWEAKALPDGCTCFSFFLSTRRHFSPLCCQDGGRGHGGAS